MRGDRWGYGQQHGRMYNLNTVETVRGTIVGTDSFTPSAGMSPGMQISVNTGTETLPIHLGPRWFLDSQNLNLASGDEIEVTGSRVDFAGRSTIVASELREGDTAIALRDSDGIPSLRPR